MEFTSLYLIISPDDSQPDQSVLQLCSDIDPGELVLIDSSLRIAPQTVLEVARGSRNELFHIAARLFAARWGAWSEGGEIIFYQLADAQGRVPPQLTRREKTVRNALSAKPNQTLNDLVLLLKVGQPEPVGDEGQIASALRYLLENGLIVAEQTPTQTTYSVRRT